ncbi:MAG: recombinase family protein [Lentisphaerae bacterium]|nr:recombinase family protein [Lentisphaerota bacterium]
MASTGKFIAYYRVSTERQGRSGLGLDAQRKAVQDFLNGGDWQLIAEFTEVETGTRKRSRPQLEAALDRAKVTGATVVIAKLDRLTRSASFLLQVVESGVPVIFCDLPSIQAGPTGKFILTQMAAVAELEAGLISERTRAALQAAKARGVRLGNPNGAAHLRGRGNKAAVAALRSQAAHKAERLRKDIADIQAAGTTTARGIARELTARGIETPRGGTEWHPTMVRRVLDRLGLSLAASH